MDGASVYEITAVDEERTGSSLKTRVPSMVLNGAMFAALLSATAAGTGGVANAQALTVQTYTAPVTSSFSVKVKQDEQECLLGIQEKIAGIRHYLSLNMTELAGVLNVGRPTVYSWATMPVTVKIKHRERVDAVYEAARSWRTLSNGPMGPHVREPIVDGMTIFDLLSRDKIDSAAVRNAMQRIKDLQDRAEKRLTVAQVAKKAGVKLASRPRANWQSSSDLDI